MKAVPVKPVRKPVPSKKSGDALIPLLIACGGIACLVAFAVISRLFSKGESGSQTMTGSLSSTVSAFTSKGFRCISRDYPIQYGTCHPDVAILQKHLTQQGADLGSTGNNRDGVDGQFGAKTQAAARKYLNKEVFTLQDIQAMRK